MSAGLGQRMFVSDIDGTLLTSDRRLAAENLAALAELRRHGVRVVLATGRSEDSFARHLEHLGFSWTTASLPVDYLVFSTGAGISEFEGRRLLRSLSLTGPELESALQAVTSLQLDHMVHRAIPDTAQFLYRRFAGENPDFDHRLQLSFRFATPFSREALEEFGGATEIVAIVPRPRAQAMATRLGQLLPDCSVIMATSPLDHQSLWLEIFHRQVSKSNAAAWLAAHCGISREEVGAIGNDYNDEDLLDWAGQAYVVAGAPPSLRNRFSTVSGNDQGGVAEAVRYWLGRS